ncbi:MAG TPA: UDP-N-acetylglucosamine 1-carboxyvinyltransferase [Clostridiaceae bacterium]|nr:UDP-N-acetylglucosamine 1-carboxyvinyltransferase [Clostridiaceae bacterium]
MGKLVINGQRPLNGEVSISGSKNASVAVLPATVLLDGPCTIENVPDIDDVKYLKTILLELGAEVREIDRNALYIDASKVEKYTATYDMVKSMRASYYFLGALTGKLGKAEVAFPGGCDFGFRPMDQHIKGFEALGAKVDIKHGIIKTNTDKLVGTQIYLDVVSVGATINIMLAAVKAKGTTTIENPAKEPHVVDVANFLNAMGADIKGAGTDVIKINGVERLPGGGIHTIIPDYIEAGTFMIAAAATRGDVKVRDIIPKHVESLSAKLTEVGVKLEFGEDYIRVAGNGKLSRANIKTLPYPGFPTDLHPPMAALLCLADGTSTVTEGIWDMRFQYIDELKRMGAKIRLEGRIAVIEGVPSLSGAPVRAMDLRAGASLVIAGLTAEGKTIVHDIKYIDRGYEDFESKLRNLGAEIERI